MTKVAFHLNVENRFGYTCRLLRKATAKGAKVLVLTDEGESGALDQALWAVSGSDFVAHGVQGDGPEVLRHSPVLIVESALPASFRAEVLVNLAAQVPLGYERFDRLIEVVGQSAGDKSQARVRWRQYQAAGIDPDHHEMGAGDG